jgi:hypothetical protein
MIRSYMYFNQIIHFASHSLHWTNISFFTIFSHFLDPCQRPRLGPPLERVPEEFIFHYFWTNFMIRSYIYFNQIIHFASHSLHWINISFFTIFCSFWTPCQIPCFGLLWRERERVPDEFIFFHCFWTKFHDAFIISFNSITYFLFYWATFFS